MIGNLVLIFACCFLIAGHRASIWEYVTLLWLGIDVNKCVAGAYEAFKDSNRSTAVIQMIKVVIDIILLVGIGRMRHQFCLYIL
jgi:hypothetical protein